MKIATAICVIALCCASVSADAQQRDRGHDGGRGYGDRGYSRGYGDRHRYYSDRRPGYRYRQGYGWFDPSAAAGAAIGSFLWRQWAQPEPAPEPVRDIAWCMNRYKSYDPYTKTYLGYDGLRHGCP
jgi:hypothetical protein